MVKLAAPIAVLSVLALTGCNTDKYTKPIGLVPHGEAVRANLAAQIINPVPPAQRPILTDANRAVLAQDAYRTGEVKDPTESKTAPNTTDAEE
ncbi:MAG: hypothetical protein AAF666_04735 [Pseudomonadota bacterium]